MSFYSDAISKMVGSPTTDMGLSDYYEMGYSKEQVREIERGLMFGVDVSCYARLDYEPHQMSNLRELMLAGYDISAFCVDY